MSVQIPRNPLQPQSPVIEPWSAKGHVQPHRNHLPRRRNAKCLAFVQKYDSPDSPFVPLIPIAHESPIISDPCYAPNAPHDDPALQEVVEGLWIAFADGDVKLEDLPKPNDEDLVYTHVVTIMYGDGKGSMEQTYESRTQRLRLVLPAAARESARPGLGLTDGQLRAARDFIIQALPITIAKKDGQTAVRVLVTTPFGRPTDAISVASCYLSVLSSQDVDEILKFVDEEEAMLSVWKGEVSGDEAERVRKIATAWSWLSQVDFQLERSRTEVVADKL